MKTQLKHNRYPQLNNEAQFNLLHATVHGYNAVLMMMMMRPILFISAHGTKVNPVPYLTTMIQGLTSHAMFAR